MYMDFTDKSPEYRARMHEHLQAFIKKLDALTKMDEEGQQLVSQESNCLVVEPPSCQSAEISQAEAFSVQDSKEQLAQILQFPKNRS